MMPDVMSVLFGFEETLQFEIVTKAVTDHQVAEASKVKPTLWFQGVLLPMKPSALLVKPEGERKFVWWTLYTDMALERDWIVRDVNGRSFRVMAVTDFSQGGYYQFDLIEGPTA